MKRVFFHLSLFILTFLGLLSHKSHLLSSIANKENQLKTLKTEEEEKRRDMESLIQVRNDKENVRRIEVYQLKKLQTEKESLTNQNEKFNSDLASRGANRVNTFDRVQVKSELKKNELRIDCLDVKIGRQEERVQNAEKDVKLFTLEKSECKEKLRVSHCHMNHLVPTSLKLVVQVSVCIITRILDISSKQVYSP